MITSVGAVEIGGSHVCAALVDLDGRLVAPGSRAERRFDPHADRRTLLAAICGVARAAATAGRGPGAAQRWGVAAPGPFDYAAGRCTIHGQAKLDALRGVDLRAELSSALALADPLAVRFGNDADAFLIGEWWAGAAKGAARAVGITLGTGLGSAFLADGRIVEGGGLTPPEGRLDLMTFRGAPVEDVVSTRGLHAAYRRSAASSGAGPGAQSGSASGLELAAAARSGEPRCAAAFALLGEALGAVLAPWLDRFRPSHVVVGGGISAAWDLIQPAFREACPAADRLTLALAAHPEDAALLGAGRAAGRGLRYGQVAFPEW